MKRQIATLLCVSMLSTLLPSAAWGAEVRQAHTLWAHEDCVLHGKGRASVTVTTLDELQAAVSGGGDIVLAPAEDSVTWTVTSAFRVGKNVALHLTVADGKTVILTRNDNADYPLFAVENGGKLILGGGKLEYTGDDLAQAARKGAYTIKPDGNMGNLILDGGAVWESPEAWDPGADFGDTSGKTAILYGEDGAQYRYANTGKTSRYPLVVSSGSLELWDGAALQNNAMTDGGDSIGAVSRAGSAVNSSGEGSVFNLYGGEISRCAVATNNGDTGRGAVFVGSFVPGNWNAKVDPIDAHFYMYGGKITRNAASGGGNQDGGGVSVEQGYMDLYGGEVSYNHAGVWYKASDKASGDGGGFMVRNYSVLNMWGGSVDHNFAGGSGGGIVAWNATVNIHGGRITGNKAAYGGGLAISSSNDQNGNVSATATMDGGQISSNEAIRTTTGAANQAAAGVGGGICVGAGGRTQGSTLVLSAGEIRQNTAQNGGGMGIYAGGGETEGSIRNTSVTMSGDFRLTNNFADVNGNGMYISNVNGSEGNPNNKHYLVKLSGGARVDTNNPVYFANLCEDQIPVLVSDTLTVEGTAAIFEFADSFWKGNPGNSYDEAAANREIVQFADGKDIQENKIALESTGWALQKSGQSLVLQDLSSSPQYTIRNGTPITYGGKVYYRLYAQLSDAFAEAADGDILYIYYNTTIGIPAVLEAGKHVTIMAESLSSAGVDAGLSGNGKEKTCWLETTGYGYNVMRGSFFKYVGDGKGEYTIDGGNAGKGGSNQRYDLDADDATAYNIRNDYTLTLSSRLYLGDTKKENGAQPAAVMVYSGATLEIGQVSTAGMGAGSLTFDGNLSSPKEGAMFQVGGTLNLHSGVTVKNHSNYSQAHPGVAEVLGGGILTTEDGVTMTGNVSPVAGAVYVAPGGSFTMNGGVLSENTGAMPRYGFQTSEGSRLAGYDRAYWGQGKYYSGAGAVYNLGTFTMNGGSLSGNRGEYGALANLGGATLTAGTVSGNRALVGRGDGTDALTIAGYTEGASPAIPGESEYSTGAGNGGGIYQGGGTLTLGSGMAVTGNAAQNGGGMAVGSGKSMVRSVLDYTKVPGGRECGKDAQEPRYGDGATATNRNGKLEVQSKAVITDNTASGQGGGIYVTDGGNAVTIESGVSLQRNGADLGGGYAAVSGGELTFANEVTENTASSLGGGVFVRGGSVTAKGSLTSNEAVSGGGAYVDEGSLTLDGARINNNRLTGSGGFGAGVYNAGTVILTANGESQPSISYNDRIYLAEDKVLTLDGSYDITKSNQNGNNKLTLESEITANGTSILQTAGAQQAKSILLSGFVTHYTHPLAQNQTNGAIVEINSVPIYYYDRFTGTEGLDSHHVEVPYAQGDMVIFQNFSVGEDEGFQAPDGKSFLYWVTIDKDGHYLDEKGALVDSPAQAQHYYAGNTIPSITASMYLEAVYGNVQYRATLQVLDEDGNVLGTGAQPMGTITLGGASYNSSTGEYSYAVGTPMTINADPVTDVGQETVLQGIKVYRELAASESHQSGDIEAGSSWWRPVAETVMDSEELDVPGGGPVTLISTGAITGVTAHDGAQAELTDGTFTYTSISSNILVRAQFKPAMVRLEIAPRDGADEYTGYYDTMHEAITAVAKWVLDPDGRENREKRYTITLLRPNERDEKGNEVVLYYGEKGKTESSCVDNDVVDHLSEGDEIQITYDLNGLILDYQDFGERNLKRYNMTIKNGTVVYNGNRDKAYDPAADPDGRGPLPSAFRVADGTLNLEGVTIRTTRSPAEGNNDRVYSAKVMENGTLNIGRGCTLGDVFVYTDRSTIGMDEEEEGSGHVTVTDTFLEGRTELVATLCLRYWEFGNQVRQVIRLDDAVAAREGVSIRRMFDLKDVSSLRTPDESGLVQPGEEQYWFIGTDGRLYKKAALVVPKLELDQDAGGKDQETLFCYWDYTNKKGKPEIGIMAGDPGDDGEPVWIGGYPIYYDYMSAYGFSTVKNRVTMTAQLLDGKGRELSMDRGNVSFVVSRMVHDETGAILSNRRSYSGTTGMVGGKASLDFSSLAELPVTETPDLEAWTSPKSYYSLSAAWSGTGQYAARYAEYWNYAQGLRDEDFSGILGGTLMGILRLSVQSKELSASDIEIRSITPTQAEYIGPAGRARGNTSSPTVGRVVDSGLGQTMIPGTDYNVYYAALTEDVTKALLDEDNNPIIVETKEGRRLYYLDGKNTGVGETGKIYYSIGGEGNRDGKTPANAMDLNGAPAGPYSVALEAETVTDSNYAGQSGWKQSVFTIRPYSGVLSLEAPNHVVVGPDESYSDILTGAFHELKASGGLTVVDQNGNLLPLESCAFRFLPVSGKAELDENGWPSAEGLYNLEVTASGHANGTMRLDGVDSATDPNYGVTAAGYRTILITRTPLSVFFVPQTISVPYTGGIYNSDMLKKLDGLDSGGYQVWRCEIDGKGQPLNEAGQVISVDEIPTQGKDRVRLETNQYRVEIGSPRNTPQDVGSYTMVVTDITGNYVGIGTLHISTDQLHTIELSESSSVYTGVDHSPSVTVRDTKGNELALNRDYVLRITNTNYAEVDAPINAGSYTYTAQGINNYSGASAFTTYTVEPKELDNSDVTEPNDVRNVVLDAPNYAIFTGTAVSPRYALYYNGYTLVRGNSANADYTQAITKGGAAVDTIREGGTYTFTITGQGNYTGTTSFTLIVAEEAGTLQITNTGEYTYNGGNFESYRWQSSANVTKSRAEGTLHLDAEQFEPSIQRVNGAAMETVDVDAPLDAGVYLLTMRPTADYAGRTEGLEVTDFGICAFQVQRQAVTIKVNQGGKLYGELDPVTSGYKTNLAGADPNTGFYVRDTDSISGQFGRNTGEDVRNGGYRYTLGSFTAGNNYVLSIDQDSVFEISPQDISEPIGGGTDLFQLEKREFLSYTGYALKPIQSMTYHSQRGDMALVDQANYTLNYVYWHSGGEGCTPGCTEEHDHGWENMSGQPTNVGWYRVTLDADTCVTSPDNYIGSRGFLFEIRAQGGDLGVRIEGGVDTVTYQRSGYTPVVSVSREGFDLNQDYYTTTYSFAPAGGGAVRTGEFKSADTKFTDAGVYTIYATGSGNYVGSVGSVSFTILPKDIGQGDTLGGGEVKAGLKPDQSFAYDGNAKRAEVTASYEGAELAVQTDYTLSYQNHVNAGMDTASVTLAGRGNYTGTRTLTYSIARRSLSVTVSGASKTYGDADPAYTYRVTDSDGSPVSIRLTGAAGRDGGETVGSYQLNIGTLSAGDNYALEMDSGAVLTILPKALGNGDGTAPARNINPKAPSYVAAKDTTASQLKSQLAVTYWAPALGETPLTGADYSVAVTKEDGTPVTDDNAALTAGIYTLTVTGKEPNYTGTFPVQITAVSANSLIQLGSGETLTYRLQPQPQILTPRTASGDILLGCQIDVTANYTKGGVPVTTSLSQAADGSFQVTLTDAGTYTVVVTYADSSGGGENVYFGTVTYVVQPKNISKGDATGDGEAALAEPEGDFSYTGQEVIPTNADTLLLYGDPAGRTAIPAVQGEIVNYIVGYSGNVNPGQATVTVYGQGNYSGSRSTTFQVGEVRYGVVYNGNNATSGTVPQDAALYKKGETVTLMANTGGLQGPENTLFLGWSQTQMPVLSADWSGGNAIYPSGSSYTMGEGAVTLYAVWAADENKNGKADCNEDKYTVQYAPAPGDACSGAAPLDPNYYLSGATVNVSTVCNLSLNGYLLLGWSPISDIEENRSLALNNADEFFHFVSGNSLYSAGRSFSMGSENRMLYAVWGADSNRNGTVDWMESDVAYFVTYDANGGSGTLPASTALNPGELAVTVAPGYDGSGLVRSGCTLLGWSTEKKTPFAEEPGAELTIYQPGGAYTISRGAADPVVVFYAVWAEDENENGKPDYQDPHYTVTYESVCADVTAVLPPANTGVLSGISVTLPNAAGTLNADGRSATFLGWTTDRDAAGRIYNYTSTPQVLASGGEYDVTGNTVLYAVWGETDYHVGRHTVSVTASPTAGGTVTAGADTVLDGGSVTVSITVADGYAMSQVMVNGGVVTTNTSADGRTATLTLSNVTGDQSVVVTFIPSRFRVSWPGTATYNQKRQEPTLTVYRSDSTSTQVPMANYTLSVTYNKTPADYDKAFTNAGNYVITVTGTGEYAGSEVSVPYGIDPAAITELNLKEYTRSYKGEAYQDEIQSVKAGNLEVPPEGYTVYYSNNVNVGTASVSVTGKDNYTGTRYATFPIVSADSGSFSPTWGSVTSTVTYDGGAHRLVPTVKNGDTTLTENVDYTLTYPDDITNAGEKKITVTGIGNYAGIVGEIAYRIQPKSLVLVEGDPTPVVSEAIGDQVYTGDAVTPEPVLTYGSGENTLTLVKGRDYTLAYANNTNTGTDTATVTVTGMGNYTGSRELKFSIVPQEGKPLLVSVEPNSLVYTGLGQKPTTITVKDGEKTLTEGTDYTLGYEAESGTLTADGKLPLTAGSYYVVAAGKGNYAGATGRAGLTITPALEWTAELGAGTWTYDGSAKTPAATVKNKAGNGLTEGTDYTLVYRNNTNAGVAAATVTGKGNYAGSKTLTFSIDKATATITPDTLEKVYGTADPAAYTYASVPDGLSLAGALTREPGEDAGSYAFGLGSLRETGGNYELELRDGTFTITEKSIAPDQTDIIPFEDLEVGYTGRDFDRTAITLYEAHWGMLSLIENTDYTVEYTQNGVPVTPREAGTYTGTVTGKGNYTGSYSFTLVIDNGVLGVEYTDTVTYDGSDWADGMASRLTASFDGSPVALTEENLSCYTSENDTVLYLTDAGDYTIRVSAAGYDPVELPFHILPKPIDSGMFSGPANAQYTGSALKPEVTANALTDLTYTLEYRNNVDAGTAAVVIQGTGNYTGVVTKEFTIFPRALTAAGVSVTAPADVTYNGLAQQGKPTVTDGDRVLEENRDYTLRYEDNTNAGTARVTVTGIGNYAGTVNDVTYKIGPKTLKAEWLTVFPDSMTYTGEALKPLVLVSDGDVRLAEGTDYEAAYGDNINVGSATVTVTGKGNYTGELSASFAITAANGKNLKATIIPTGFTYNGSEQAPAITVTAGNSATPLVKDTDYTLGYKSVSGKLGENGLPRDAGVYTVVVKGIGNYEGSVLQESLTIAPAAIGELSTTGGTKFTYDGDPHAPELASVTATVGEKTLELTPADYTVTYKMGTVVTSAIPTQVGSYELVVTAKGNFTGEKTVSFIIVAGEKFAVTAPDPNTQVYNGLPYQPKPTVKVGERILTENTDYALSYPQDVTSVGEKTITVKGLGNYAGLDDTSTTYSVTAKSLGNGTAAPAENIQVLISDQIYDGTAKTPAPVVIYKTADGRTLFLTQGDGTEEKDFTVTYGDNTAAGTARATITGHGNYSGSIAAAFTIASTESGSKLTVTVDPASFVYTGSGQEPGANTITVRDGEKVLERGEDKDYTVRYEAVTGRLDSDEKPLSVGTYNVVIVGKGNYDGAQVRTGMAITPAELGEVTLETGTWTYDGGEKRPNVTVKNGTGSVLDPATDYTLVYQNNKNAGTAAVTVIGKGNYAGSKALTFSIQKAAVTITPNNTGKVYGNTDGALGYEPVSGIHLEGSLTREPGENVGSYAFHLGTLRETSGNYELTLASAPKFTITAKSIADGSTGITPFGDLEVGYTGTDFDRTVTTAYQASWGRLTLAEGTDYTVTYAKEGSTGPVTPKEAGTYTGTVTGMGNYKDHYTFTLTVKTGILGVAFTTAGGDTVTYNGADWAVGMASRLTAKLGDTVVPVTLSYKKNGVGVAALADAGDYTIVVTPDDTSIVPVELPFHILPKTVADGMVSLPASVEYTGSALEPPVTVTGLANTDYAVNYQNNTNAGTATVTVTGKGNYTGTVAKTFAITQKALPASVTAPANVVYNGFAQQEKPTVAGLTEGVDYALSYSSDCTNVGTVTVTVTGQGNYAGTATCTYDITAKTLETGWLTVSPSTMTYTGGALEPLILVTDGAVRLSEGTDYTAFCTDNVEAGTATVTVAGKGNYQGTITGEFTILADAGGLTVALSDSEVIYSGADQKPDLIVSTGAYTATYSYNGGPQQSFDSGTQMVDVGVYAITVNGTGSFEGSSILSVFMIRPADFTVEPVGAQSYTGAPVTPEPTVLDVRNGRTPEKNVDYLLSYGNNVALGEGTASITVTGLGNYAGTTRTVFFTITGETTLFRVTYDGNGMTAGTAPVDNRSYLSGERAAVLSGTGLKRTGAAFLGWSLSESGLVTSQAGQDAVSILQPGDSLPMTANMTLYAVWAVDENQNNRPDYAEQMTITASAGEGGTISPNGNTTVAWGTERVEYTITVNSGYTFSGLTVDGQPIALSTPEAPTALSGTEAGYRYAFTDLRADHVIVATFRMDGGGGGGSGGGGGGGGSGGGGVTVPPGTKPEPIPVPAEPGTVYPPEVTGIDRYLLIGDHTAYVYGRENGFEPNATLTRAEVATMFYRMLKDKDVPITVSFLDVPEDSWYTTAVLTLGSLGLMKGVGDGYFAPERELTRQEFAAIAARMAYEAGKEEAREYADVSPDDWFYKSVRTLSTYGWMMGYPDGTFGADRNISRAEVVKVLNHMTCRFYDKTAIDAGAGARFPDVGEGHWAFYEIVEAATTHDFELDGGTEIWKMES